MTCQWPLPASLEHLPADWESAPSGCKTYAVDMASRALELLCGGRVSVCPVKIRPQIHAQCCLGVPSGNSLYIPTFGAYGMYPLNWNGTWSNGVCPNASLCEVDLPAPVGRIDEVKANGEVLSPSDYRVDDGHLLTWVGTDPCPFPHSQDITVGDDQPDTMSVIYVNAYDPGASGSMAMSILAYEFMRGCLGQDCRLPDGVTTIIRQGLAYTVTPGHWPDGKTGISDVDSYIALWNPRGHLSPSQVWSPDLPNHRVIGG